MPPIRIILADDHASYRTVVRDMLAREAGLEVVAEAANGVEAVRADLEHDPDVVILDVAMPQMDGMEAARLIVARRPLARILALSLHSEACFVEAMLQAGACGYVLKQDPFTDLVTAINEVAAGRRFVSANILPSAAGESRTQP